MKRFIILCLLFAAVSPVAAFQIQYGRTVTINQPVFEDLYVTGGTVIVNAPIHGDLIVAGGTITVNDTVISDILVTGGRVTFNGYVGSDLLLSETSCFLRQFIFNTTAPKAMQINNAKISQPKKGVKLRTFKTTKIANAANTSCQKLQSPFER